MQIGISKQIKANIPTACKVNLKWKSNHTDVADAELFEMATSRFDELLDRFYIRFFQEDVSIPDLWRFFMIHRLDRQ